MFKLQLYPPLLTDLITFSYISMFTENALLHEGKSAIFHNSKMAALIRACLNGNAALEFNNNNQVRGNQRSMVKQFVILRTEKEVRPCGENSGYFSFCKCIEQFQALSVSQFTIRRTEFVFVHLKWESRLHLFLLIHSAVLNELIKK